MFADNSGEFGSFHQRNCCSGYIACPAWEKHGHLCIHGGFNILNVEFSLKFIVPERTLWGGQMKYEYVYYCGWGMREKEERIHVFVQLTAFRQFRDNSESINFQLDLFVNSRLRILWICRLSAGMLINLALNLNWKNKQFSTEALASNINLELVTRSVGGSKVDK